MQPWGEWPQVLPAPEEPQGRAVQQSAHPDTHVWPWEEPSAGEPSAQPGPQQQHSAQTPSLLDELLAVTELQEKAQPFLNGHPPAEEPPGTLEGPLSEEEFQALLDMLQSSPGPQI